MRWDSAFSAAARCSGVRVYAPPPTATLARCLRANMASSSSESMSEPSSSPSVEASMALERLAAAAASASARFLAAVLAALVAFFSTSLRSVLTRSFLGMRAMRSRSSSSSSESESESPPAAAGAGASEAARAVGTGADARAGSATPSAIVFSAFSASTSSASSSSFSSDEECCCLAFFFPFFPPPFPAPAPEPPAAFFPCFRMYTRSSLTRLALLPIIFFTFGSFSGLPSSSMARTFFSFSSPNSMGRSPILLSLRKISASSAHLPISGGTSSRKFFLALSVTSRCLPSRLRSSSEVRWLPSTTSVTSSVHEPNTARLVSALCARRRFSSAEQSASSAGSDVIWLCSASSTLSCDRRPMAAGSDVSALLEMISVRRPERRATSAVRLVRRGPSASLRLLTEEAHQTAGSTSMPSGSAPGPEPPGPEASTASSLRLPAIARATSGHTGIGRASAAIAAVASSAAVRAAAAAAVSRSSSASPTPPAPRRSRASRSLFFRLDRCVAVSPSGASGSTSSTASSSVSSSSLSPPRLMRAASSWNPFFAA
mmetsp:Transcript_11039/g.26989  ORF Transcript_11039/g.26989 Transcript_11039/m.26989 type:complete len:545 (-) Transcript_11039:435-2069(-)